MDELFNLDFLKRRTESEKLWLCLFFGGTLGWDIGSDPASRSHFVKADISDSEQVQNMVKAAVDTYGRLDVAVNNAALPPDDKPVAEFDEDYWDKLMSIDLKGTALCLKYELQQLIKQGEGGSIINISSVSGFRPQPDNVAYVGTAEQTKNPILTRNLIVLCRI